MFLLLGCSAFFSGSETAFFNLSRRQTNLFEKSKHKLHNLAAKLLSEPKHLLSCLLFGNMVVNVLFYAVASIVILRLERQIGAGAAVAAACISFAILVLFGEILPKSLAYANSKSVSIVAALPAFLFVQIFRPVVFIFRFLIVEPVLRLLLGPAGVSKSITPGEFKSLVEQVRKRGLVTDDENRLLSEIVELGFLKVRDCLRPRVDMAACAVTDSRQTAIEKMQEHRLTKLPVYVGTIDNIVGLVHLRQLLLKADAPLDKLVGEVHFVPEQKAVESLLEFFRTRHIDTAVVVDEYGGIAGLIRLEDIAEELLGPIEVTEDVELIEQTGPFEYRLSGNLSIHDWAESFGVDPGEVRISTIGGLVTALLGKIPRAGDVARLRNLSFTVERVERHRIETVILTFEPMSSDD